MTREYLEKMVEVCTDIGDMNGYFHYWCKLREMYAFKGN